MELLGRFIDVCEKCDGRELDFIFFDLQRLENGKQEHLKDIPGFRCRDCGETLVSMGVLEVIDDIHSLGKEVPEYFPALEYQKKVLGLCNEERELFERYLHSWNLVRADGRMFWSYIGYRRFGDWKELACI